MKDKLEVIYKKWIKDDVLVNAQIDGTSTIHIKEITIPDSKKQQGRGTQIICELKAIAEAHNCIIYLEPSDHLGTDLETLRKIYFKWGFVPEDETNLESKMWYPELP